MEKTAEKVEAYTVRKDGNGYEYKIANHNSPDVVAQSGIILIEALKRSQLKQPRVSFKRMMDPNTGITYGIPLGINKDTGVLDFQRIIMGDMLQFDLANEVERKMWTVISRHECMKGSPFSRGIPKYKVVDKDAEADRVVLNATNKVRALKLADEMTGVELYDMAINLGLSAEYNSHSLLKAAVIEMADKKPDGFIKVYDNTNRNVITVFNRCKALGLIRLDVNSGYTWKDSYPLGMNETLAIKTIATNPTLLSNMDIESKMKSNFYKANATKEEMEAIAANKVDYNSNKPIADDGFMSDAGIKATKEKMEAETKRTSALNDRLERFLNSQEKTTTSAVVEKKLDVSPYKKYKIDELQDMALEAGFALAKTVKDRLILIKQIEKLKK